MAASCPIVPDVGETIRASTVSSAETCRASPPSHSAPPQRVGIMRQGVGRVAAGARAAWPLLLDLLPALSATIMANAIILPKPSARWLGSLSFLTYPFIHLFYYPNPNRTIGGQLELFCIGLTGGTIGCAISFLIVACAVWADERYVYHHHPQQPRIAYASGQARTIGAMGMLVLTFGAAYVQSSVPRMKPGTRICLFDMTWIITMGATEIKATTFLDLFWPSLCAGGVCLLATILIRPKTANQVVVQQLTTFLTTVDQILAQTTTDFFHPATGPSEPRNASPRLIALRLTLLKTLTSIGGTFHAASYELSYARIAARQYAVALPVLGRIRTWIACGMGLDVSFRAPVPAPTFGGKGLGAFARPVVPREDPLPSLPLPGQRRMLARMLAEQLRARQLKDGTGTAVEDEDLKGDGWESSSSLWHLTDDEGATTAATAADQHDPWSHGRATFEQFEEPVTTLTAALHGTLRTIAKAVAITTGMPPPGMIPEEAPPSSILGRIRFSLASAARRILKYYHFPVPPTVPEKQFAASLGPDMVNEQVALNEALDAFGRTLDTVFSAQFRRSALVHAAARAAAEKAANSGTNKQASGSRSPRRTSSDSDHEAPAMNPSDAQTFLDQLAVFDPDMYAVASLLVSLLELAHEVSSFLGLAERGVQAWLKHQHRRIHLPLGRLAHLLPSQMSELGPAVLWSGLDEHDTHGIPRSGVSQGRGGPEATFTATVVEEGLLDDELLADADAQKAHQDVAAALAAKADNADMLAPTSIGPQPAGASRAARRGDDQWWMNHDPDTLFPLDPDAQFVNRARNWAQDWADYRGSQQRTSGLWYGVQRKFHAWARTPETMSHRLALSRWIRSVHRSRHIKFAIKLAAGTTLLALPNWVGGSGRRWFVNERAQWIIITYVWCLETSTAATLMISMQRMAATITGAFTGVIIYEISRGNGVGLGACMAVVELVSAYFLTQTWATSLGIVFGVTYSVVALIPYLNLEYQTVPKLGWNRGYQIFLGIVAAMLVNLTIWPYHARSKLARHVGGLARDLGGYYLALSRHMMQAGFASTDAVAAYFANREAQLGARLATCRGLLALVTSEVSLVPDPLGVQVQMLCELQAMADRLTGLRLCREHGLRHVRRAAVGNVMELRRAFIASLLLCLWSAGQALSTRSALPQFLPSPRIHLRALTLGLQQQIVLLGVGLDREPRPRRKRKTKHMLRSPRLSPWPQSARKEASPEGKKKSSSPPLEGAHPRFHSLRRHRTAPVAAPEAGGVEGPLHPSHLWPDLPHETAGPLARLTQSRTMPLAPSLGYSDRAWVPTSAVGSQDLSKLSPASAQQPQLSARRWSVIRGAIPRPDLPPILGAPAPHSAQRTPRRGRRRANTDSAALPTLQPRSASIPASKLDTPLTLTRTATHATPAAVGGRTVRALRRPNEPGSTPHRSSSLGVGGGCRRPSMMVPDQAPSDVEKADQAEGWEDTVPAVPTPAPRPSKRDQVVEAAVLFLLAEHVLLSEIVEAVEEVVRLCRLMLGEATFVDPTIVPIPAVPPASPAD